MATYHVAASVSVYFLKATTSRWRLFCEAYLSRDHRTRVSCDISPWLTRGRARRTLYSCVPIATACRGTLTTWGTPSGLLSSQQRSPAAKVTTNIPEDRVSFNLFERKPKALFPRIDSAIYHFRHKKIDQMSIDFYYSELLTWWKEGGDYVRSGWTSPQWK